MIEVVVCQELQQSTGEFPLIVVIQIESLEEEGIPMREVDPQKERDTQVEIEGLPEDEVYQVMDNPQIDPLETHLEEEGPLIEEDPLIEDNPLIEEDHLVEEDPLMMEDLPVEMENPQDVPIEEEPQDQEDPLDQ